MRRIKQVSILAALIASGVLIAAALILIQPQATQARGGDRTWTGQITALPTGFPPNVTGTWMVGGLQFEADSGTTLVQLHGNLGLNVCAQVEYFVSGSANVATKISSEDSALCGSGQGEVGEHMKVYSYVNRLPAGFPVTLTGEWTVGNITYTAGVTTRFDYDGGPFAVGSCVGVEYISDSVRLALELGTQPAFRCASTAGAGGGIPYRQVHGVVDQLPTDLVGMWTVSGIVYTATSGTRFEQEFGPFFVKACVEVKYTADRTAVEISTAEPSDCGGGAETPESKFYGVINNIPVGNLGIWTIGGGPFVVTTTTVLTQEQGTPLAVGVCAEVEYHLSGTDRIAAKIQSEDAFRCNTNTFTNDVYGTVSSFPPGLFGTWVITRSGGFTDTFSADPQTQFNQLHGSFAQGVCVKVQYFFQNGVNRATEIETQSAEDCRGDAPPSLPGLSKVFAKIDSFPPNPFVGQWGIGGVVYSATTATEFSQLHGNFATGLCVKASYTAVGGVNVLHEVETEDASWCLLGGVGVIPAFKSFGVIESFPTGLTGQWQVSGITYTANLSTEFKQVHGFYAVGAFVQVEYAVTGTNRIALSIETHVAPGAGRDDVIGILEAHDLNDDHAPWVVGGITYTADSAIEVEHGGSGGGLAMASAAGPAIAVGQRVELNTYRSSTGVLFVTLVKQVHQVFLPVVMR